MAFPNYRLGRRERTTEPFTIPVDYDNAGTGSVGDPPAGRTFISQEEVDDFLVAAGWTAFKHVEKVFQALPDLVDHQITINLAPGVHRPATDAIGTAWYMQNKAITSRASSTRIESGNVTITGALSSQYLSIVGSFASQLTVQSFDAGSSGNPSMTFAGTPFAGMNLRGRYAITNGGQVTTIHDHTDDTLYVCNQLSPTPTTAWVGRPSTILRNSYNDSTTAFTSSMMVLSGQLGNINLADLSIEGFGMSAVWLVYGTTNTARCTRVVFDDLSPYEQFGKAPNGRILQQFVPARIYIFTDCSYASPDPIVAGNDGLMWVGAGTAVGVTMTGCYWGPSGGPNTVSGPSGRLYLLNTVFNKTATLDVQGIPFTPVHFGTGKFNELRGVQSLHLTGATVPEFAPSSGVSIGLESALIFKDMIGPAVVVKSGTKIDLRGQTYGFVDGGGNADVGFEFDESGSNNVILNAATTVTGATGDIRMADGTIISYVDLDTYGPHIDSNGNVVGR
jgi:hypothetical protein